jgi:hypothetical protein
LVASSSTRQEKSLATPVSAADRFSGPLGSLDHFSWIVSLRSSCWAHHLLKVKTDRAGAVGHSRQKA